MTVAAQTAFGAELWLAPTGEDLVKVGELLSLTPPKPSRSVIDATTHDSPEGAMESIPEQIYDPGQIQGQVNYIAGSAGDLVMIEAMTSGALQDFALVDKGAAAAPMNKQGSCFMTEYGPDAYATNGKQTASFAMKVSGVVTQAAGAIEPAS